MNPTTDRQTWQEQEDQAGERYDRAQSAYSASDAHTDATEALHEMVIALQRECDSLRVRLYGREDSGGTDGGEVGRLRRDVDALYGHRHSVEGKPTSLPAFVRDGVDQPHRRTTDEGHTYTVATS